MASGIRAELISARSHTPHYLWSRVPRARLPSINLTNGRRSMELIAEQRRWLAWLANVRIIVLTFLLGIQLAIVRLTSTTLPLRPFIASILLWYTLSLFFLLLASL